MTNTKPRLRESDFYQPFADYLVGGELKECTKAIRLGGNKFGGKWGTPDVIGVFKHRDGDYMTFPPEFISAEIKWGDRGAMPAFGQACAYKQFSHKSYVVVPKSWSPTYLNRLESACQILGIGLVFCEIAKGRDVPDFEMVVRAQKHEPDMLALNDLLRRNPGIAEKLFSG